MIIRASAVDLFLSKVSCFSVDYETDTVYFQLYCQLKEGNMFASFAPESVGRRINILFRMSMRHLRQEMKDLDVGTSDYAFLAMLFVKDGQSQDELSRNMQVDKSYTARAVAKLEKSDMVRRLPDPHEHRIKRVFLTEKAWDKEKDFFRVLQDWHNILIRNIDPDTLRIILAGMDQMIENGQASLGDGGRPDDIYLRKQI